MKIKLFALIFVLISSTSYANLPENFTEQLKDLSATQLKANLQLERASYSFQCAVGAVGSALITGIHAVPVLQVVSTSGAIIADHVSGNPAGALAGSFADNKSMRENRVNSKLEMAGTMIGGAAVIPADLIEATVLALQASSKGEAMPAPPMRMSKASWRLLQSHYSRLLGEKSGCKRSLDRAAAYYQELNYRSQRPTSVAAHTTANPTFHGHN